MVVQPFPLPLHHVAVPQLEVDVVVVVSFPAISNKQFISQIILGYAAAPQFAPAPIGGGAQFAPQQQGGYAQAPLAAPIQQGPIGGGQYATAGKK